MLTSEMISKLEKALSECGDLPIEIHYHKRKMERTQEAIYVMYKKYDDGLEIIAFTDLP